MNKITKIGVLALFVLASTLSAQIILTPTTLSSAITASQQTIVVASATPNTSTPDNFTGGRQPTGIIVDGEYMTVNANYVSGTTINVVRGQGGTTATAHSSGALAWSGQANHISTKNVPQPAGGNCVRTQLEFLPVVNAFTQTVTDCNGGKWVRGNMVATPPSHVSAPDPGATLYTGINTNGTAVGATTLYCTEMNIKQSVLLTGLSILNGTTVTGNLRYAILYDSGGNLLANSALAGQGSVTASVYENYAFTRTFYAVGPARYFSCLQDNAGGSTTVRMAITGQSDQVLTKGQTGATFGTVPTLTVPTTFTTAVGPFMATY